ncbi:hypothetical protein BCV69DRAFT_44331 [Microstroma glucosiphilum]|uniref:Uncharacterized protein n=1 Tax=Pseudomicrostroma glucosiphilum TaxID=1684307 RepID=A0A316U130_9BASI|nr:hypothetical protein BCV69DRAFT_44331 [Pseudomicrostroma glucosiphilum]PWN19096.1 hypothetical protein BCV69DRAFT_44331 [Pseudomicrostroma glucosiphilum]
MEASCRFAARTIARCFRHVRLPSPFSFKYEPFSSLPFPSLSFHYNPSNSRWYITMPNEGEPRLVLVLPEDGPWPLRLETSISFAPQQGSSGLDANEQARTLRTATNRGSAEQGLSGLDANEQARTLGTATVRGSAEQGLSGLDANEQARTLGTATVRGSAEQGLSGLDANEQARKLGTATVRGRTEQAFAPAKRPRSSTNHEESHTRNDLFLEIEDDEDEEVADLPVAPRDSAYAADLARPARTSSTGVRAGPRVSFHDDPANEQYSRGYEARAELPRYPSFTAEAFKERFSSIMSARAGPSSHRASSADALSNEEHSPIAAARAWTSYGAVWDSIETRMKSDRVAKLVGVVLEREDVRKCGIKTTAKDGEHCLQFKIKYEPDLQAIDRLTSEEAAELRGTKICFKIWQGDTALTDWLPLRRCKPTPALQYLYCEAMKALCEVGAATKETVKKPALKQGKDNGAANTLDKFFRL